MTGFANLALLAATATAAADGNVVAPSTYELIINGESFIIEANRATKLQSRQNPQLSYDVALRIAPTQRLKLNSIQLQYDRHAEVTDDRKRSRRTVRIAHELGYTVLVTDLGRTLDAKTQDEALKILADSAAKSFRERGVQDLVVGEPKDRKFAHSAGRGLVIRYRDQDELAHTCLVYVLAGPDFGLTCIVQYLDDDFDEFRQKLKETLDSIRKADP